MAAEVLAAFEPEHLVEDQPGQGAGADCRRGDDGGGLQAIENAKKNGRWEAAYDSPRGAAVPEDLQTALAANPRAKAFFETLNKANRYAVLWRIQTVKKAETRARKIAQFVAMLEKGEKLHP